MTGVRKPETVVQFRAVPFAAIPGRFKQSVLADSIKGTEGKFTEHGYACPQVFPDHQAAGGPLPGQQDPQSDEFGCLILQINAPLSVFETPGVAQNLPVLVYIHGGGFILGRIDEQHSTSLMVEQAIVDGQPIISVSIQYRLGALGYLHTPEAGNANLALNDQRNALLWIQKFIGGFGGNPQNVTVFGESAGAMSICAHMIAPVPASGPLFHRAILMSGVLGPLTTPTQVKYANKRYETLLQTLGIVEKGEAGLEQLRALDVQKIVDASAEMNSVGAMWCPVQDEEFFGNNAGSLTWDKIPELMAQCEWVNEIMLGTTSFEGTTFIERMADVSPKVFLAGISEQLGEESANLISQAYHITPDMDNNLFITRGIQWIGDVIFDAPVHNLAKYLVQHTSKKIYRYVFDARNPFPNSPLYQQPHHWVDVYFVFKTFQFRYPLQRLKDLSTRHAQIWNEFANGRQPWNEYRSSDGEAIIMVADEKEGWVEKKVTEYERLMETTWKRCEALVASWESQQGRTFSPVSISAFAGKKLT